jgi:hypothetical protein
MFEGREAESLNKGFLKGTNGGIGGRSHTPPGLACPSGTTMFSRQLGRL